MRITIIETGRPPGRLSEIYPPYPDMFTTLLQGVDDRLTFAPLAILDGEPLPDPATCEAVVITGSPVGVYDATPWMGPLRTFIQAGFNAKTPMVGVCFGHQIMADALGGVVRKSEKGWGVGRHAYSVIAREPWMVDAGATFALGASHQDQVMTPPPGARTLARSAHTEHAMLVYEGAPFMSLQGHPEFSDGFLTALYSARRGVSLPDAMADAAIESLARPGDEVLVGDWMARFLRSAALAR